MQSTITTAWRAQGMLAAALLLSPLLAGCYNARIRAPVRQQTGEGSKHVDTGVSFFWGASNTTSDAIECPMGLAYTETYHPWWGNFIVSPLTLGIIVPIRKVWICADPLPAAAAQAAPQVIIVQPAAATTPAPAPKGKE